MLGKAGCAAIPLTLWQVAGLCVAAAQGGWFLWLDGSACLSTVDFGVAVSTDDLACPDAGIAALGTLGHRDKALSRQQRLNAETPRIRSGEQLHD